MLRDGAVPPAWGFAVHIDELRERFGLSRHSIHHYVREGIMPPPAGWGRWARYGPEHVAAIAAYRALKDNNTTLHDLGAFLREEGIGAVEYLRRRESYLRENGLGYV